MPLVLTWSKGLRIASYFFHLICIRVFFLEVVSVAVYHLYAFLSDTDIVHLAQLFESAIILLIWGIPIYLKIIQLFLGEPNKEIKRVLFQIAIACITMNSFAYKSIYRAPKHAKFDYPFGKYHGSQLDGAQFCFIIGCVLEYF